jgi:hypothetical protein
MAGRPPEMRPPQVSAPECAPKEADVAEPRLICPTYGLEKFDLMVSLGLLREAYRDGETVIYEVLG